MFNPQRAARYLYRFVCIMLPVVGSLLALSLCTELLRHDIPWNEARRSASFWAGVARDMVPGLGALLAALLLAARFVQRLYGLPSLGEALAFVNRCLFGLWGFRPWIRAAGGVAEGDQDHVLIRGGGPGHLVIYNDTAVVLERGGQFTRVEFGGFPRLLRHERPQQVVDLRPLRRVHTVQAMSREGIPIECEADVCFQIERGDVLPTEDAPFPATADTVFQAATALWNQKAESPPWDRTLEWSDRIIFHETDNWLRTVLARYPLDQLIGLGGSDTRNPREDIRLELQRGLEHASSRMSVRIQKVELGDIRVCHDVTQQWIDAWKAEWKRWSVERRSRGSAVKAEQLERARTQAQVQMLTAIAEAFQPLVQEQKEVTSQLILARLFMVLSRSLSDPLTRVFLPMEAISTLKTLRGLTGGTEESRP